MDIRSTTSLYSVLLSSSMSSSSTIMSVKKRNGELEAVSFDKVITRIGKMAQGDGQLKPLENVNIYHVAQKVCSRIYDGVKTSELDDLASQICSSLTLDHPDYGKLAARIVISNHQKNTSPSFSETIGIMYHNTDEDGNKHNLVSDEVYEVVEKNKEKLNDVIRYERDFSFDYFGFRTLERGYLMKTNQKIVERPQHMIMRVALGIHGHDVKDAIETYDLMSQKYFTHATPTLFNAGTPRPQCSSCFLQCTDDSLKGIFGSIAEIADISKLSGGIGLALSNIRGRGSLIRGTNGESSGIIPLIRVINNVARYVNQGGKRNGSIALYLEPWHPDIYSFLELRKNHGAEEDRARDIFTALWVCDLFMKRVQEDGVWSLMCPDKCKGLFDTYGDEFESLYTSYEARGMFTKQVKAQDLWQKICTAQIETGTPYMLYKDHVNRKNNQKNLGVIKSSNLCTEIMEYTSTDETAVCNLASICLPTFIKKKEDANEMLFDFQQLHRVTKVIVKNLNKIIDLNYYPSDKARHANLLHRPLGIGVQGMADMFVLLKMPFESAAARTLNAHIFETIYFAALEASMELAKKHGKPYSSFSGSPASQGILQFDLWNKKVSDERHDWTSLKEDIKKNGLLNSLLLAPMPTASTSQIMGYNECFEPFTSNIYKRKTLAGEFILVNKYLIQDLQDLGMWNQKMCQTIIAHEGSIQGIEEIPQDVRDLYKVVWEIKQRSIIDLAADRGAFIDQSQSMNMFVEKPDLKKITSMHFYGWNAGLKTGMYYLRSKAAAKPQQFTMDQSISKFTNLAGKKVVDGEKEKEKEKEKNGEDTSITKDSTMTSMACPMRSGPRGPSTTGGENVDDDVCLACGS